MRKRDQFSESRRVSSCKGFLGYKSDTGKPPHIRRMLTAMRIEQALTEIALRSYREGKQDIKSYKKLLCNPRRSNTGFVEIKWPKRKVAGKLRKRFEKALKKQK